MSAEAAAPLSDNDIYERIVSAILDHKLLPGTKLVEDKLGTVFGVSRTRIRVNRITALQNDLALALAAPALRVEAPVPGKPMVGIEVPNGSTALVSRTNPLKAGRDVK